MEFKMPVVKKSEFETTYLNMRTRNNIHDKGVIIMFNNTVDFVIAEIEDSIIHKLSPEQISQLHFIAQVYN